MFLKSTNLMGRIFLELALKYNRAKDILQKRGLKYVLAIPIIFQMYHAKAANRIAISSHGRLRKTPATPIHTTITTAKIQIPIFFILTAI